MGCGGLQNDTRRTRTLAHRAAIAWWLCMTFLSACGGSGGGSGTSPMPPSTPLPITLYSDITTTSGIDVSTGFSAPMSNNEIATILPNGAASGDFDGDGRIDLFIVRGDIGPNLLYRNLGGLRRSRGETPCSGFHPRAPGPRYPKRTSTCRVSACETAPAEPRTYNGTRLARGQQ